MATIRVQVELDENKHITIELLQNETNFDEWLAVFTTTLEQTNCQELFNGTEAILAKPEAKQYFDAFATRGGAGGILTNNAFSTAAKSKDQAQIDAAFRDSLAEEEYMFDLEEYERQQRRVRSAMMLLYGCLHYSVRDVIRGYAEPLVAMNMLKLRFTKAGEHKPKLKDVAAAVTSSTKSALTSTPTRTFAVPDSDDIPQTSVFNYDKLKKYIETLPTTDRSKAWPARASAKTRQISTGEALVATVEKIWGVQKSAANKTPSDHTDKLLQRAQKVVQTATSETVKKDEDKVPTATGGKQVQVPAASEKANTTIEGKEEESTVASEKTNTAIQGEQGHPAVASEKEDKASKEHVHSKQAISAKQEDGADAGSHPDPKVSSDQDFNQRSVLEDLAHRKNIVFGQPSTVKHPS